MKPHFSPALNRQELQLGKAFAATHDGLLPGDNFWSYLRARHELNATRFDHYHPRIAPMLDRDGLVRAAIAAGRGSHPDGKPAPGTTPPAGPAVSGTPDPGTTPPPGTNPGDNGGNGGNGGTGSPGDPSHPGHGVDLSAVPEPSTLLSVVTSVLLVAAVLLVRRLTGLTPARPKSAASAA